MKLYFVFICVLSYFTLIENRATKNLTPLVPSEEYTHSLVANEDVPEQYQLFWKRLGEDEIQFEVHCKTTGWIGLGLSPNGGMTGSDIAIGWYKDNQAFIKDCYATGKTRPLADAQQDFFIIDGAELNGYTILKFKRKLVTCDLQFDKDITIGTQYLVFAWNNNDPVTGNNDWQYHGTNRMARTTMLLSYKNESIEEQSFLPSDTKTYDFTLDIAVPPKDTYYYCKLFELPKFTEPNHLIQFEMLVNPKNKLHVHHLLVYECVDGYTHSGPYADECGSKGVPGLIAGYCLNKMIIAWGIGGQYNYTFPKKAGYRFDPSSISKYILVEMHYDNPNLVTGITDDSGVRLYLTKQLREHDLGLLTLGVDGNLISLSIPPKSNHFSYTSLCYPQCTQKYIPEGGIYAVSALLHTHLSGRSVKTTLVRNGVTIKELFDNPNYDFNYQFLMDIEPTKIEKGDALLTRCVYNTMDRDKFTFFGFSTYEEMCYDFVYYYPRIPDIQSCMSYTPSDILKAFYESLMEDSLIPYVNISEYNMYSIGSELIHFFQNNVTMSAELTERFETFFSSDYNKTIFCGDAFQILYEDNIEHYKPIKNEINVTNVCVNNEETTNLPTVTPINTTLTNTFSTTLSTTVPNTTSSAQAIRLSKIVFIIILFFFTYKMVYFTQI